LGAVLIGLAFAFVAVAAYYIGIRKAGRPDQVAETQSLPLDRPYEDEALPQPGPADEADVPVSEPTDVSAALPTIQEATERPRPRQPRYSRAPAAPDPTAFDIPIAQPVPVIVQPVVRGRIIQLGAYPSQAQAELAWQAVVKKWPYLATKPRLVSPIDVRSTDGKATRMHRLQLATASQAQSAVICQQLAKTRQSCVVVY
jgi:hypothetical protein